MPFRSSFQNHFHLFAGLLLTGLLACSGGGGSGGSGTPATVVAPSALVYATNPALYTLGQAIPANVPGHAGDAVTGYTITPTLPAGLALNPVSGTITGTPTVLAALATYTVTATNGGGSTTVSLSLSVNPAPVGPIFTTQPVSLSLSVGQNAHFTVAASGTPTPALKWQASTNGSTWSDLGVTGTACDVLAVTLADDGRQYRAVASNATGTVNSNVATLTVAAATITPVFITQPVNLSLTEGQNGQFVAAVSGTPTPALDWQVSVNSGPWFSFGVTTPVYNVYGVTLGDSGRQYRVVATNAAGTTYSNTVTLTVNAAAVAPAFTIQPTNVTVTEGQSAQFTVAASGTPVPTLQWQLSTNSGVNWSNLAGETGTTYTALSVALTKNGWQYRVVATNTAGVVNSNAATLTVHAAPGAKAFGTATLIESGSTGAARPRIAFAPNGDAMAVWMQQSDGVYFHIWANRYTAATNSWGTEALIGPGAGDAWDPRIAIDSHGNALVVWYQDGDPTGAGRNDIWSNYYTAGSGWGGALLVETDNAGPALSPQVAFDPSGVGVAVWLQSDGTASQIRSNRFTAGAWGTVAALEASTPGASRSPQIAIDASGNALAVWSRSDGTSAFDNIWANRYTAGSGWGTAGLIETDNTGAATAPQVAFDASGNALAVWQQSDGSRRNIWSNRYHAGTGWGTAELIEWNNGADADNPQISVDANGDAVAVWQQSGSFGTPTRIWSNRYTVGSGWGGFPALIQTDLYGGGTANATAPQIAMDASGNALAVWIQPDGASDSTPDIWVNRYTVGSGWGTTANLGQVRINIPGASGSPAGWPQIAIDANGNALVVWYQSDGIADSIWSNRYQ